MAQEQADGRGVCGKGLGSFMTSSGEPLSPHLPECTKPEVLQTQSFVFLQRLHYVWA